VYFTAPKTAPHLKVSAILKGKPDQFNRLPIVIRINQGEKRSYKNTPFRIEKSRFTNGLTDDPVLNAKLKKILLNIELELLQEVKKYPDAEFFVYVASCMREWAKIRAYNTLRNYRAETEKLRGFRSTFKLSEVTPQFLKEYSQYLYKEGNISTTVWTAFKFIRMVILKAKRERLIEENPFDIFKIEPYRDPQKEYLTKEQVQKIEAYLPDSGAYRLCATWFVIGCYTGLRYSDMNAFSKEKNIKSGRLVLATVKTKEVVSMPLTERLKRLFSSINYQPMFISNQKFNDALKVIGKTLELGELTVHQSRHTFGVMCAEAGISQEVTARLLGHRSLKSTAIYYRITNPRIDAEIGRLG
jgi:integrase